MLKPHKWAKEIKAWADGIEVEYRKKGSDTWYSESDEFPYWDSVIFEYRIKPSQADDLVNHPAHYTSGGIEAIDYMQAKSTPEEFRGHLRLTTLKYLSRAGLKDDTLQDYEKAAWYLNKLIEVVGQELNAEK